MWFFCHENGQTVQVKKEIYKAKTGLVFAYSPTYNFMNSNAKEIPVNKDKSMDA
jgi:hypothetical protein